MEPLILNCDLCEEEPAEVTAEALRLVHAVNISCPAPEGSYDRTRACLAQAHRLGVLAGAHPGLPGEAGRARYYPEPAEFSALLERQMHKFLFQCFETGALPRHIKLHGNLYHLVDHDPDLAEVFLRYLSGSKVSFAVFSRAGGPFAARAREAGLDVREEIFADRHYAPGGALLPRSHPSALITNPAEVASRLRGYLQTGLLYAFDGTPLRLPAQTVCVHADTPGSLALLRAAREVLAEAATPPSRG